MGDLGTFDGLKTTVEGQVLDADERPIPGLYAVGNDRASIMGGNYPGAGITLGPIMTFGYITGRHLASGRHDPLARHRGTDRRRHRRGRRHRQGDRRRAGRGGSDGLGARPRPGRLRCGRRGDRRRRRGLAFDAADRATIAAAAARIGPPDILVNNAGILRGGPLAETTPEDWDLVLRINLTGYLACAQAFGAGMRRAARGAIVHVASIAASEPQAFSGAYSPSKAAVAMLSRQLAFEWGPDGVRSNSVSPGMIRTPLSRELLPGARHPRGARGGGARPPRRRAGRHRRRRGVSRQPARRLRQRPGHRRRRRLRADADGARPAARPREGEAVSGVLVTGGAAGIGWAIARAFAARGDGVAILDLDGDAAAARAAELGPAHLGLAGDVERRGIGARRRRSGRGGAGRSRRRGQQRRHRRRSGSDARAGHRAGSAGSLAVHLEGTFLVSREAARHMLPRRRGSIVNIASIAALGGLPAATPMAPPRPGSWR